MHKLNQFRLQVWHRGDLVKCVHPSVHPHVCGERGERSWIKKATCGSSPRVWGTLSTIKYWTVVLRFIPTCVGNATTGSTCRGHRSVHPHVCGERSRQSSNVIVEVGSSPRVWGTLVPGLGQRRQGRFIPTCVGNANSEGTRCPACTVHPHVCGERAISNYPIHSVLGSSPRVWGTLKRLPVCVPRFRFIPTCVGNAGCKSAIPL